MSLPTRLLLPATHLFEALRKSKTRAVLFGGAAVKALGGERDTTDLDVNVVSFDFVKTLPLERFAVRDGSTNSRLRITFKDPEQAVKCDVAKDKAEILAKYYDDYTFFTAEGICVADAKLLLMDKMRTITQRATNNDSKRATDLDDIIFLVEHIFLKGEIVSDELKKDFLNSTIIDAVCGHVVHKDPNYLYFFENIGVSLENPENAIVEENEHKE